MPSKNLRIFIGPVDIANVGALLASGLRERGIKVTVVNFAITPFSAGMKYDKVLDFQGSTALQRRLRYPYYFLGLFFRGFFLEVFLRHNVFIFLFGRSLLPYNLDLPILKLFHKKTIMWFLGSDIRHYEFVEGAIKNLGIKYWQSDARKQGPDEIRRKKKMVRRVEKYVDHIICGPSNAQLLTRYYHGKDMDSRIYLPLDVENIKYNNTPNPRPVLIHAPSSKARKGTSHVLAAIERLQKEGYKFEFYLFRSMSNREVREALSRADIAVDQLFATGPGMFALESMAAGCAVLGGNVPEFSGYPRELPIIRTDPDNIYQNLKMLLENPELRRELGEKGRRYVEKYHDSRKIADDIIRLITTQAKQT